MARPGFLVVHAILDILAGTPPEVVGTYVLIHQYIARKNLSGRMVGAARWTDGTWLSACRCRRRHVDALVAAGGAEWQGNDLVLDHYDQHGETRYGQAKGRIDAINERRHRTTTSSDDIAPRHRGTKSGGGTAGARARAEEIPSPSPSVHPARDPVPAPEQASDGDDGGGYHPHDIEPEPLPGPGSAQHLTTAVLRRVDAVDAQDVRAAAKAGSLRGLVAAFQGNVHPSRAADWLREADGLSTPMLVVLFAQARQAGDPIREPSGLRKARERLEDTPLDREMADALLALYGLKPPSQAAAGGAP